MISTRATASENLQGTKLRRCRAVEIIALAQRRRLVGAAEGGEGIGGSSSGIPGPVIIFSEDFFVGREGGFAEGERFGCAASRQKKACEIATHAICVWMFRADHLEDRQRAFVMRASLRKV